jgi:hypothetical protein
VVFPYASSELGFLPDTVGIYDNLPDEPVDFFRFKTYSRYTLPPVNLLTMTKDVATKITLWTTVCTTDRHYLLLNYNEPDIDEISGHVQVTAYDDDGNGVLDYWVIEPLEGTNSLVRIVKQEGNGKNQYHSDFGYHNMPFKLILERL